MSFVNIVTRHLTRDKPGLYGLISSITSVSSSIPSKAFLSALIGIITSSAAARALSTLIPTPGGQSIKQ